MKTKYFLFITLFFFALSGCNDDFMERYPIDAITDNTSWKSESDLKLYCNAFYPVFIPGFLTGWSLDVQIPYGYKGSEIPYGDLHSDNALPTDYSMVKMVNGTYIEPTSAGSGGWNWSALRNLNYFLINCNKVDIAESTKQKYVGEVLFFKAFFYFKMIKQFGEVPWYSKPLETNSEELYAPRTPRAELMDSVLAIISNAVAWLPGKGSEEKDRINKDMALLLKARICLYEGTFRKYHTELGISGDKFLQEAADASDALINSNHYSIWSTGNPESDYFNLFIQDNYDSNSEVLLSKKYADGILGHSFLRYFLWYQAQNIAGSTKSFVEEYLCSDGLPISVSPLYKGDDSIQSEMMNRDPRLRQTVCFPGEFCLDPKNSDAYTGRGRGYNMSMPPINGTGETYPTPTGYWPVKFWKNDPVQYNKTQTGTMPCPVFRYAEILLINAEAKAELGTCTQTDLDATINKLRDRVGMPYLMISNIPNDPLLDEVYSTLCGYVPSPLIREIRRERRVELAWENFRWDDLCRWKAGKLLLRPESTRGMKFNQYQYPKVKAGMDVYLGSEGYLEPYQKSLPNGRKFEEPKQYYFPIPIEDIIMNENLQQNPGWAGK